MKNNPANSGSKSPSPTSDSATGEFGDLIKIAQRLTESEARFRVLVEASSDVVYRMNADWTNTEQLIGRNFVLHADGPHGNWIEHWVPDEDKARIRTAVAAAIRDKSVFELKYREIGDDGRLRWTFLRAVPLLDLHGEIREWFGMATDITEQVEAEKALGVSEERFRMAMEASHEGIWEWNWQTGDVYYSPRYAEILGYDGSGLPSNIQSHVDLLHPDDQERIFKEGMDALASNGAYCCELRIRRRDGVYIWMHIQSKVIERDVTGKVLRVIGAVREITDRVTAENRLRESEQKFRNLFENMSEEVQVWRLERDGNGKVVRWCLSDINPAGLRRWGRTREETLGKGADELFPGAIQNFLPTVQRICEEGTPYTWEAHVPWGNRFLRMTSIPLGELLINTVVDVTAYRSLQDELTNSNQLLDMALSGAGLGTWDWDFAREKLTLDDRFCRMIGYTQEEISPTMEGWLALVHPDDLARVKLAMDAHTAGETAMYDIEYRLRHKHGHWVWVWARGGLVRDKAQHPLRASGVIEDISRRRRVTTEGKELLQKMEQLIAELNHRDPPTDLMTVENGPAKAGLSARNIEVLRLIAQGMTAAEIGRRLYISSETVVTHRQNIMRKLGLRNKAELIRYAIEHKLSTQ